MVIVDKVAVHFAGWNCKVDKAAFVVSRVPLKVKLETKEKLLQEALKRVRSITDDSTEEDQDTE